MTPFPQRPPTPIPVFPGATPAPGVPVLAAHHGGDPDEPTRIEMQPPDMPELAATANVHPAGDGRRRRVALAVAAAAGALVAVVALAVALGGGGDERGEPAAKRPAAAPVQPPRAPTPAPTPTPVPVPAATPVPVPAATPVEPAAPEKLTLTIRSEPPGALVADEKGARLGNTPFTVTAAKGSGARSFLVRMRRFHDRRVDWSAESSESLDVRLQRRAERPPAGSVKPGGESVDPNATDNPFRTPR